MTTQMKPAKKAKKRPGARTSAPHPASRPGWKAQIVTKKAVTT